MFQCVELVNEIESGDRCTWRGLRTGLERLLSLVFSVKERERWVGGRGGGGEGLGRSKWLLVQVACGRVFLWHV